MSEKSMFLFNFNLFFSVMKNSLAAKAICQVSRNQLEEDREGIPWRLIDGTYDETTEIPH